MATTPQRDPMQDPAVLRGERKLTVEERRKLLERFVAEVRPFVPKDWDLDAELEAEHRAVLAGHDI